MQEVSPSPAEVALRSEDRDSPGDDQEAVFVPGPCRQTKQLAFDQLQTGLVENRHHLANQQRRSQFMAFILRHGGAATDKLSSEGAPENALAPFSREVETSPVRTKNALKSASV